jgi:hypothetical protein
VALAPGVHFWRLRDGARATPAWSFYVRQRSAAVDTSWGSVPDVDGDGYADLLVGASHAGEQRGRVDVFRGARGGIAAVASQQLAGPEAFGHFGWWVASAGDVNGDGYADVIVGAPDVHNNDGAAYLYLGSAAGLPDAPSRTLAPPDAMANFGTVAAGVGDINGDGYADVAVGAPNAALGTGRVLVYLGSPAGLPEVPSAVLEGPAGAGAAFGSALAPAGDVNGDGYADVVVGANGAAMSAGLAYVYLGAPAGIAPPGVILGTGLSAPGAQFGAFVSGAGDVDGDGYADIAVGAPSVGAGRAMVFRGGRAGPGATPAVVLDGPDGPNGSFGWAATGAGDVNGDGFDDLVVGAICAPFGFAPDGGYPQCGAGRAYVFHGGASGVAAAPALMLQGPADEGDFGFALAGAGDLDGDGFGDVAVGAFSLGMLSGGVFVFAGSTRGLGAAPAVSLPGDPGVAENFGWSVARARVRAGLHGSPWLVRGPNASVRF